jgi:hypothetical protein
MNWPMCPASFFLVITQVHLLRTHNWKQEYFGHRKPTALQETKALARVFVFAKGFLSGPRHRISLPSATLSTEILTELPPLPRVGPSAGWDLGIIKSLSRTSSRHETHRQKTSERRHIWVAVHCADGSAVGTSAQMPPVPSTAAQLSAKPLTDGHRQLSGKASKPW